MLAASRTGAAALTKCGKEGGLLETYPNQQGNRPPR